MHKNEWTFWMESVNFWHNKAEEYLSMNMEADALRCISKADKCLMMQYEGQEHLLNLSKNDFIVSGRKGFGVAVTIKVQVGV